MSTCKAGDKIILPRNGLDISRRNLALRGRQSFAKVSEWAQYARDEINMVGGYYADEYDIQIEFGDIGNIMAYISIGDRIQDIERLVGALAEISRLYSKEEKRFEVDRQMLLPRVLASPQEAFYADKIKVPIREAAGHISGEFVMAYPPGIPILAPGEEITDEIIDYIQYSVEKGCSMQMHRKVYKSFPISRVYQAHIPTCPSGYWLFGFA